jgi:uncharacterized NAD-dependent epimerase/dehydratase family protein
MPEGNAIVYCEGAFNTPIGKTAHGLVRHSARYNVLAVIDSSYPGMDAGEVLDGKFSGIPLFGAVEEAFALFRTANTLPTHFVVGLAPDGGRLTGVARQAVQTAIELGMNVDSGLHDFLSEDPLLSDLAQVKDVRIRDIRKSPPRDQLHFFSGKIEEVESLKIAVLGTDSAVGKRTTAILLVRGLLEAGILTEFIGTGQTAWMQGSRYSIILDSLVNDFVSGEIEHVVWSCWNEVNPDVIVIEGQGSLMNPAYPGGFEVLAAARPDLVILQHAPGRKEYDGFPGYPIQPLAHQIQAIEVISRARVAAITVNHENLPGNEIARTCKQIEKETFLKTFDVLLDGPGGLVDHVIRFLDGFE